MKRAIVLFGILIILSLFLACPGQAFTAKNLDIAVQDNTDAVITFSYELSWFENFAVFLQIANPGTELKGALENSYGKPVVVMKAEGGESQFMIPGFASKQERDGIVTMNTPALSFVEAEKVLTQYWFAPLISPDFSPALTRVHFPDGYSEEFYNQISIPAIQHPLHA